MVRSSLRRVSMNGLGSGLRGGLLALGLAAAAFAAPTVVRAESAAAALGPKPYTVSVDKVAAKRGQAATTQVVIRPGAGYHVNLDYPVALKLVLPSGVTAAKNELKKADAKVFTEKEGRFEVALTSSEAGPKAVTGQLAFAVCTATTCEPQKAPITIEMSVQ